MAAAEAKERYTWTIHDPTDGIAYEVEFPEPLDGDGEQVGIVYLGGDGDPDEDRVRIGTGPAAYKFTKGIPLGRGQWVWAMDRRWFRNRPRYAITDERFDHREERARRERDELVTEALRRQAPVLEAFGTEIEKVKGRVPEPGKPGRPRTVETGKALIAQAHRRRTHEGRDADEVARELYPNLYHESPPQARKRVYDADYTGKQQCPDCQQAVAAGIEKI